MFHPPFHRTRSLHPIFIARKLPLRPSSHPLSVMSATVGRSEDPRRRHCESNRVTPERSQRARGGGALQCWTGRRVFGIDPSVPRRSPRRRPPPLRRRRRRTAQSSDAAGARASERQRCCLTQTAVRKKCLLPPACFLRRRRRRRSGQSKREQRATTQRVAGRRKRGARPPSSRVTGGSKIMDSKLLVGICRKRISN